MATVTMVTTETVTRTAFDDRECKIIYLRNCRGGIGIKIVGGKSTLGPSFGIFVKKVLAGGIAERDGKLREGDQLLQVNGESMMNISNDRAMTLLRNAAQSNNIKLIVTRDEEASTEFENLMSTLDSGSSGHYFHSSQPMTNMSSRLTESRSSTPSPKAEKRSWALSGGRMSPLTTRGTSPVMSPNLSSNRMELPRVPNGTIPGSHNGLLKLSSPQSHHFSPYTRHLSEPEEDIINNNSSDEPHSRERTYSSSDSANDSGLQSATERNSQESSPRLGHRGDVKTIAIPITTSLGLSVTGGVNRPDGPGVYVDEIVEGGDLEMDGRVRKGDQILAVNKESFVNLTHEQAKSILTRLKLRNIKEIEITFKQGSNSYSNRSTLSNGPMKSGSFDKVQTSPMSQVAGTNQSTLAMTNYVNGSQSVLGQSPHQSTLGSSLAAFADALDQSPSIVQPGMTNSFPQQNLSMGMQQQTPNFNSMPIMPQQMGQPLMSLPQGQMMMNQGQALLQQNSMLPQPQMYATVNPMGAVLGNQVSTVAQPTQAVSTLPETMGGRFQFQPPISSTPTDQLVNGIEPSMPQGFSQSSSPQGVSNGPSVFEPSSVPYYLQQDLEALQQLNTSSPSLYHTQVPAQPPTNHQPMVSSPSVTPSRHAQPGRGRERSNRRLSLDPSTKLKVEKLEVALRYLGFEPNEAQNQELRRRLHIDPTGCVSYGEFVDTARQIFQIDLQDRSNMLTTGSFQFAIQDINNMPTTKLVQLQQQSQQLAMSQPPTPSQVEDVEKIKRERDEALREVRHLRKIMAEQERETSTAEEELERARKDAQWMLEESKDLRNKAHLADQAQQAARSMEQDYEEVIRLLENEIAQLKTRSQPQQHDAEDLQKRLVVVGCQLRKAEVSKRTLEVATEKLIKFAENVHEALTDGNQPNVPPPRGGGRGESVRRDGQAGPKPPSYLSRHSKHTPSSLAKEARDTVKSVKALMEEEPLPFGWEEAYTPDGVRFYINHVTQVTSWVHPVTSVQHLPSIKEDDGIPESRA